jgi:hypothetical protein
MDGNPAKRGSNTPLATRAILLALVGRLGLSRVVADTRRPGDETRAIRITAWVLAAVAGLVTAGCEDGERGMAAEDLAEAERVARCEYQVRCGFSPDMGVCWGATEYDRSLVQAVGSAAFGNVTYDPVAAKEWIDQLRDRSCDRSRELARAMDEARAAVFEGHRALGEDCFADEECNGLAVCDRWDCPNNQTCCTGTCVATRELTIGETCPLPDERDALRSACEELAWCQPDERDDGEPVTTGTCTERMDNGQPCTRHDECLDGQLCDLGGRNQCYRLSEVGEPCNPNLSSSACLGIDQVCDPQESICVSLPGDGQSCVQGRCQPYAVCDEDTDVCRSRPYRGQSCDGGGQCLGDLRCRDERCTRDVVVLVCVAGEPPPEPEE